MILITALYQAPASLSLTPFSCLATLASRDAARCWTDVTLPAEREGSSSRPDRPGLRPSCGDDRSPSDGALVPRPALRRQRYQAVGTSLRFCALAGRAQTASWDWELARFGAEADLGRIGAVSVSIGTSSRSGTMPGFP